MSQRLPFCGFLAASGNGEVWDHSDENKFKQFGWRCTTNETEYSHDTLIGNWNEERYDIKSIAKRKPLPSQVRCIKIFVIAISRRSLQEEQICLLSVNLVIIHWNASCDRHF